MRDLSYASDKVMDQLFSNTPTQIRRERVRETESKQRREQINDYRSQLQQSAL